MSKTSSKRSVSRLVKLCASKGLKYVVISPGSRNAPLTLSFAENDHFNCINIPDERAAAFFALGIAQKLMRPVALCCTSGTALLNYAPAIAEAYYQKIPLLVLSADRPIEWIDQRAGQTMRQRNVFENFIKKSYEFIEEAEESEHLWYNDRIANEAINCCTSGVFGPVHLNIPLREPLYNLVSDDSIIFPKIIGHIQPVHYLDADQVENIRQKWHSYKRVLIIIGQRTGSPEFDKLIEDIAQLPQVVVLTETTSNVRADYILPSIDRLIDSIDPSEYESYAPELVISCGAAIVSKKIRFMLRAMHIPGHWHIDPYDDYIDTYQSLTRLISVSPEYFLSLIIEFSIPVEKTGFKKSWQSREKITRDRHRDFIDACPWSDLFVMSEILKAIPNGSLHLASSTPVRYAQLFHHRRDLIYLSNRGVSGIDGCTSTAAGYAFVSGDFTTLITGDIAFFYDSNGLWHQHISSNFRIILINNGGGNIFRYVKGPDTTDHMEEHFEAAHNTSARGIAMAHEVEYYSASNKGELEEGLLLLYRENLGRAAIIEIHTPREENIPILKDYFKSLTR